MRSTWGVIQLVKIQVTFEDETGKRKLVDLARISPNFSMSGLLTDRSKIVPMQCNAKVSF